MYIPPGKTEEEVLAAIERSVNLLAKTFPFGFYDIDDIKQHGRMEAVKLMNDGRYDPKKPLENFIYTHIKNRYLNLRRNLLMRSDAPCKACHSGQCCTPGGCAKYLTWQRRNLRKASLMRPVEMEDTQEKSGSTNVSEGMDNAEMMRKIDEQLPVELRLTWKQILDGMKVPKAKSDIVRKAVQDILGVSKDGPQDEDDE